MTKTRKKRSAEFWAEVALAMRREAGSVAEPPSRVGVQASRIYVAKQALQDGAASRDERQRPPGVVHQRAPSGRARALV